jgi:hypothetical protein
MNALKVTLLSVFLSALALAEARATVIVTYAEKPGAETSSFINATTFTFDTLALGVQKNVAWSGVGSFDQLDILKADQYGGAYNPVTGKDTQYSVQGVGSSVSQTILNLNSASAYFGLWWSAGDAANVMDFYSGADGKGTLLAEFTTANLIKALPSTYRGNPNPDRVDPITGKTIQNTGENYAFINFFATPGSTWSSIVFKNSASSGFEADNFTSRVAVYDPTTDGAMPGVVLEAINGKQEISLAQAPEPSAAFAMLVLGGVSAGGSLLRRFSAPI